MFNAYEEWTEEEREVAEKWLREKAVERYPTGPIVGRY
jgi:hypothetical protein